MYASKNGDEVPRTGKKYIDLYGYILVGGLQRSETFCDDFNVNVKLIIQIGILATIVVVKIHHYGYSRCYRIEMYGYIMLFNMVLQSTMLYTMVCW